MAVLFVFVDGIGRGTRDPAVNPLAATHLELLSGFADSPGPESLPFGGHSVPLDATMGVDGTPQSATGQTALLSGQNAARANGGHLTGFPNELLRGLLSRHSLLKRLRERGRRVTFANAFQPIYFLLPPTLQRRRTSATTAATLAAGLSLRTIPDIAIGEAVYHDYTNSGLSALGFDVPERTPEEAGHVLGRLAGRHDFVLYEHFLTDKAGHSQDMDQALAVVRRLERFLGAILETVDLQSTTVLVASDHGNLEDLSRPGHTCNHAMGLVWGQRADWAAAHLRSVTDVSDVILALDESAARGTGPGRTQEVAELVG